MGKNQKYSIDLKLQVVGKYKQGICGYKKLAREFNLSKNSRDCVGVAHSKNRV